MVYLKQSLGCGLVDHRNDFQPRVLGYSRFPLQCDLQNLRNFCQRASIGKHSKLELLAANG